MDLQLSLWALESMLAHVSLDHSIFLAQDFKLWVIPGACTPWVFKHELTAPLNLLLNLLARELQSGSILVQQLGTFQRCPVA